jgi:hypothetical protein
MAPLEWRTVTVTADDIGPELNMAAWIMMVLMCLATALRLGNKYFVARVGADDVLAIVAAVGLPLADAGSHALTPSSWWPWPRPLPSTCR